MPHILSLTRHGAYDEICNSNNDDTPLSEAGRQQVERTAASAIAVGLIPECIVHSPITRTTQTAEILKKAFEKASGTEIPLIASPHLRVGNTRLGDLMLAFNDNQKIVMAVSHQPNINSLSLQMTATACYPDTAELNAFEITQGTGGLPGSHICKIKSPLISR